MNEPLGNDAQGPGFLIIKLVSHMTAMRGKIQTLEKDLQGSRQSESEARAKLAKISGAQVQEATETQKENVPGKEIPDLKLQIQSLTSKIQCDALEIKKLGQEKEQLNRAVAAISAKRAEEQKMYITALDSINKGERERESLNRRLTERQCKLTVFLMILRCASYLA